LNSYATLLARLADVGARYRVIDHPAEGRTDIASTLRGHALDQAAKSLVVRVGLGRKRRRYVVGVVPGDRWIDLDRVRSLFDGSSVAFAARDVAERLTGCAVGTIMPFSFDPRLQLIVDPALLAHHEIYFNAARLDRSVALATRDYLSLAEPRLAIIAATEPPPSRGRNGVDPAVSAGHAAGR
jgi:Ala-tRNA(Pro) deacylase